MTRAARPTTAQEGLVRELHEMLAALAEGDHPPTVWGHMRVETRGRRRDLFLGSRTSTGRTATVLDWRTAPVAEVFFRYQTGDEYEIEVANQPVAGTLLARHRLRFVGAELVEIAGDDTTLVRSSDGTWSVRAPDAHLELPEPSAFRPHRPDLPVLDVDQQRAVERPADVSLVIDGEAGVGKTVVALHRLAHLYRRASDEGRRFRALILAPTEGLRRLCRQLADRLGADRVAIEILDEWLVDRGQEAFPDLPPRNSQDATAAVIRLKRHPAVRSVLGELIPPPRVLGAGDEPLPQPRADLLHLFGDRGRLERIAAEAGPARGSTDDEPEPALPPSMIEAVVAHTHVQFTETTEEELSDVDADRLATVDGRAIDDGTPLEDAGTFDVEDVPVLFALAERRGTLPEGLPLYDHIVIDEAQLVAPMELRVIRGALAADGIATVAGDHRQETDDSAWFAGWPAALHELGIERHEQVTLAHGYRSAPDIAAFARALVDPPWAPAAIPAASPALRATAFPADFHAVADVSATLDGLLTRSPTLSIAVVARNAAHARRVHRDLSRGLDPTLVLYGEFTFQPGVIVTHCGEVQGLEFDVVVIPDVSPGFYPDTPEVRRILYVAVTRARDWLWLTTSGGVVAAGRADLIGYSMRLRTS